jgi:predicted TIM-barrel fold metal-dependent hydrolase
MHDLRAADCHAHVFCRSRLPYAPDATYQPHPSQAGTVARFLAVLDAHGLTHGLLVGPEPYGTDNRCLLDSLAAANGRLKGIALVKPDVADRELAALADCGVVGIRFNLSTFGMAQFGHPATGRLLARLQEMGWFLQIHCEKDELVDAAPIIHRAKVRVIVDHFGRPDVARGPAHPGFQTLLELGRSGDAVVKLSGPFRSSREGWPYADVEPFIAAAIEAFTLDCCVWGSDWPFVRTDERIDYGPELACLQRWLPDEADRRKVLWDTPARLFGFA